MMIELEEDERFVWFGFLLLAGDCAHEGRICATENSGYTDIQLADLLKTNPELIKKAKKKFLKFGKIEIDENGIILILKWQLYQSEYFRQKSYRVKLREGVTNSSPSPSNLILSPSKEEEILKLWNDFAEVHGLAKIQGIIPGSKREAHLKARIEGGMDFIGLLDEIARAPFLLGQKTDFKATFDWILCPSNYQKIIEGNYRGAVPAPEIGTTPIDKDAAVRRAVERNRKNFPELDD